MERSHKPPMSMRLSSRVEDALQLLKAEYLDLPDLCLTSVQIQRLLELDALTTQLVIDALVDSHFLETTRDGRYIRHHRDASQ